ncbi:hypothetical protein VCHA54P486_120006 [Vibrio chagasii]|nr:hypothetical protein VCHA54P486_120006 [Vibrio chagasii]
MIVLSLGSIVIFIVIFIISGEA